jgi:gluconate 2-dehydrogenase gamma chain
MGADESFDERTTPARPRSVDNAPPPSSDESEEALVERPLRLIGRGVADHPLNRRRLLATGAATGVAATALTLGAAGTIKSQESTPAADAGAAATPGHDMAGMEPGAATNQGFTYFVPFQAQIVQAAAARLIPTDETGPGATEAGVVYFIDRQLAKQNMGFRGKEYQLGPYMAGEPTQGDQSALSVGERFRIGIFGLEAFAQETFGKGFVACSPEEQDQLLTSLSEGTPENFGGLALQAAPLTTQPTGGPQISEDVGAVASVGATAFFNLLWQWTLAGFFCDPVQGGNRDMVGWKLIGFPGAHISWADQIENYNQPFAGDFISLGQYQEQVGGGL